MSQTTAAQALADLQASQVAIQTSITAAVAEFQTLEAAIAALQAAGTGVAPADVEAVVAAFGTSKAALDAAVTAAGAPAAPTS